MSRRLRYSVAMSLDGFIADREGGYDWIVEEPGIDFGAYLAKIDTLVMGRGTYETALEAPGGLNAFSGMAIYVVSTTLDAAEHPGVTMIGSDVEAEVRALKGRGRAAEAEGRGVPGSPPADVKDIWLFGGGVLFRSLLEAGLVDRVEVAVVPVLLGEGVPVLPGFQAGAGLDDPRTVALRLHSAETFPSGIVLLKYDVGRT